MITTKLLPGYFFYQKFPSWAGQSFEWLDQGTLDVFKGYENASDTTFTPLGYIINFGANFAGDEFEAAKEWIYAAYQGIQVSGFIGKDQLRAGSIIMYIGFIFVYPLQPD